MPLPSFLHAEMWPETKYPDYIETPVAGHTPQVQAELCTVGGIEFVPAAT